MHTASGRYWGRYNDLPENIQKLARVQFELLKADPAHPSLHFKRVNGFWSVRINDDYRALGMDIQDGIIWFWIGNHKEYERLIG